VSGVEPRHGRLTGLADGHPNVLAADLPFLFAVDLQVAGGAVAEVAAMDNNRQQRGRCSRVWGKKIKWQFYGL
jgi:hypothetical protein